MANELGQDPLVIDTNVLGIDCNRIHAVKFDSTAGGTAAIGDFTTGHRLWSTDETCFDILDLSIPEPSLINVAVTGGGIVYIYLGSGPR